MPFNPKGFDRYTCKSDYRHYKKGEEVLLREPVAQQLLKDGVVESKKDSKSASNGKADDKK